ncbi:hypothetical protein Fot_13657 [Forsythia ovata]|uniref:Uncharacterized protein n=1 Tax=Forsythia ovata TaxID=205694 RepID=A0ABD1W442_9LAMI
MAGKTRGRSRIDHQDTPLREAAEEEQHPLQFTTVHQFTALQDQMTTIMNMLQRVIAPLPAAEIPPAFEIPPYETMQTHEMTSTSCYTIPANWENLLNEKVDKAIARRKNR